MTTTSPAVITTEELREVRSESQWVVVMRRFRRHRMAMISLALLIVIFTASLMAPLIAPFPRDAINLDQKFITPLSSDSLGRLHLLGTDHLGRDYFTRLLYAARVSLMVAVTVSTLAAM